MLLSQPNIRRVLIVDDCELTRLSLQILLSQQPSLEIVGCVSNGMEAIASIDRTSPDLIILDWQMPVANGLTAATEIKKIDPNIKIIVYSEANNINSENIDCICPKDLPDSTLLQTIDRLFFAVPAIFRY